MKGIENEKCLEPSYSIIESEISFYKRDLRQAGKSFREKYSQRLNFVHSGDKTEIILLSRRSENRPVRWSNADECTDEIEHIDTISVKKIDDRIHNAKKNVRGFKEERRAYNIFMFAWICSIYTIINDDSRSNYAHSDETRDKPRNVEKSLIRL